MSDAESATTANEALSAMKQASPVRPHGAQRNGCSGVVDTTAGLRQAKIPELQDEPLSPDRQRSESSVSEKGALEVAKIPHRVRIDENANEVIEIRAQGRGRPVDEKRQLHALPGYSVPMSKEEREKHDKWLEEQMTKELEGEDGASSPEYVTDDELFGGMTRLMRGS